MRAKGLGAKVIVTEVDPVRAIEAHMDGFTVMPMKEAAAAGDYFVTVSGNRDILRGEHFARMKDGAILANAGHFDVEINVRELAAMAVSRKRVRRDVEAFTMPDGRTLYLLAEGRLVNLAAGDGHPAEIMDMSFALQALALRFVGERHAELGGRVVDLPRELDEQVARIKLEAMGIAIDDLSDEQQEYLDSWSAG